MIKAIIFDLDGLLIDTEIISYKIYKEILAKYGHSYTVEEYSANYSGKTEIKNVTSIIEKYTLPLTIPQMLELVSEIEARLLAEGVALKEGAMELLTYLQENRYQMAIATSSTRERALSILNQHSITGYFEQFVFAEDLSHSKPHPEVFLKACDKLNRLPSECLVLEDSEAGIQAASAAAIPVICIPDMKQPAPQYLHLTVTSLVSLKEVISYLSQF